MFVINATLLFIKVSKLLIAVYALSIRHIFCITLINNNNFFITGVCASAIRR